MDAKFFSSGIWFKLNAMFGMDTFRKNFLQLYLQQNMIQNKATLLTQTWNI